MRRTAKLERAHPYEYYIWQAMRQRCLNSRCRAYPSYGGRGVTICERWSSFKNFLEDMGCKPTQSATLERINNDGDYGPDNCRWATRADQVRNKRDTVLIERDGIVLCLKDWADKLNIHPTTVRSRLRRGWGIEKALVTPAITAHRNGRAKKV